MDFANMLAWKADLRCANLSMRHLSYVADSLGQIVSQNHELTKRIEDLPDGALTRILVAPELYYLIRRCLYYNEASGVCEKIGSWVESEYALLDPSHRTRDSCWTALGDAYFPANSPGLKEEHEWEISYPWNALKHYNAPMLHDSIVIDFCSPNIRRPLNVSSYRAARFGAASPYDQTHALLTLGKLRDSFAKLSKLNAYAHRFVLQFGRVIMPRHDTEYPASYTSSSSRGCIGRIVLNNPHLVEVDDATIVSALVHEAIHAFLYIYELSEPLLIDTNSIPNICIRSPWTGGLLSIRTYMHACVVWYALALLWRRSQSTVLFLHTTIDREQRRAVVGFNEDITEPLVPYRQLINPRWLEQIDSLNRSIR